MPTDASLTRSLLRFSALIAALRDGPLERPDLLERLGDAYPRTASARPMIDRDVKHLAELGIVIEISRTRPPRYTLRGGAPLFSAEELRALALVRDTFGERHPQTALMRALLERLTNNLSEREQQTYARRQALRAPVQPAIDYTPYVPLIAQLEDAISKRQMVAFAYRAGGRARATPHRRVEPYEIEYYERHFYLVAYTHNSRQMLDFRLDRIDAGSFQLLARLPPGMEHAREPIAFRYRLAAELARGELSQRFEQQRVVERLPNGDVIIEAEGRSDFFIVQTLLRYRANAELLEPAELREKMAEEVRGLAAVYRDEF
ncbi:MAG: helix-turn-helix transcriptional regulator [Roseiflexaceae bacterium]